MFLSREQIEQLTGYKMPKKQAAWLARNGVRHWIAATGRPVVPCSAIDGNPKADDDQQSFEPRYVA